MIAYDVRRCRCSGCRASVPRLVARSLDMTRPPCERDEARVRVLRLDGGKAAYVAALLDLEARLVGGKAAYVRALLSNVGDTTC